GPDLDVDRQRDRSRDGRLRRLVRLRREISELVDDAEPLGYRHASDGPIARHAVVCVEARLAQRLDMLEALHLSVERLYEEEATHLAVANHVDAGALLVADGELRGIVEGLLDVGLAVVAGLDPVERAPEPAREPVTPHDMGRNERKRCGHLS